MRKMARVGVPGLALVVLVIVSLSPALATTISDSEIGCRFVSVSGRTEVNTSYVRVQVVLGSDLTQVLATQVVRTRPRAGASYHARLDIRRAHLAEGTHVVIAVGEWDGEKYLRPATLSGADCGPANSLPTSTSRP